MHRFTKLLAVAALAMGSLVACGDDDDTGTAVGDPTDQTDENGENEYEEFCSVSEDIDSGDGPPSEEQLEEYRDAAPDEIRDDVDFVVDKINEDGLMAAFGDPDVADRFERIEAFEDEHCPHRADREEQPEPEPQEPDEDATVVNVSATDYAFAVDGTVPTGKVAFVMQNDGDEPHHIDIVRFKDEYSLDEVLQAFEAGDDAAFEMIDEDADLADQTTSTEAGPGEQAVLNVDLEPGNYGLACFVPDPDGVPHFFHGMFTGFTVE